MTMTAEVPGQIPWWKEPTKEQWKAWVAAWLGWTLDAFDFTIFLLIIPYIATEFGVSRTTVTWVFTITLWLRLVGATQCYSQAQDFHFFAKGKAPGAKNSDQQVPGRRQVRALEERAAPACRSETSQYLHRKARTRC